MARLGLTVSDANPATRLGCDRAIHTAVARLGAEYLTVTEEVHWADPRSACVRASYRSVLDTHVGRFSQV